MEVTSYKKERLHLDFYPHLLTEEAEELFQFLEKNVPWTSKITPGKRVNQNYGDEGMSYKLRFGEKVIERKVLPWSDLPLLLTLRERISKVTGAEYNYCVIQRYPNGNVGINPHRDREMKPNTDIAGLSLGSTRILTMTPPRYSKDQTPLHIPLPPGSLYVLKPPTNQHWAHSIEKEQDIRDPRISLTFRLQ